MPDTVSRHCSKVDEAAIGGTTGHRRRNARTSGYWIGHGRGLGSKADRRQRRKCGRRKENGP